MTSTSQLGSTGITLQFDLNRNIDAAARDVYKFEVLAKSSRKPNNHRMEFQNRIIPAVRKFSGFQRLNL